MKKNVSFRDSNLVHLKSAESGELSVAECWINDLKRSLWSSIGSQNYRSFGDLDNLKSLPIKLIEGNLQHLGLHFNKNSFSWDSECYSLTEDNDKPGSYRMQIKFSSGDETVSFVHDIQNRLRKEYPDEPQIWYYAYWGNTNLELLQ